MRAPTRAPNAEVRWRTPLGQLEHAPLQTTPVSSSITPAYLDTPPSHNQFVRQSTPPTEFIGPQSAFRHQATTLKPSSRPSTRHQPTTALTQAAQTQADSQQATPPSSQNIPQTQHSHTTPTPQNKDKANTQPEVTHPAHPTHSTTTQPATAPDGTQQPPLPPPSKPPPPPPPQTVGQHTPQYQPRTRQDPYSHISTQIKAAPPLPPDMAWRMAPGKWGDPQQIVQSMIESTAEIVKKARFRC